MYLLEIFFIVMTILLLFNSFGFFLVNRILFLDKRNQDLVYASSILGVCTFILLTSFFYFILDFNIKLISILFIIIFFFNFNKQFI
jgi:ABC-type microcin C transport system permease subunit YejE